MCKIDLGKTLRDFPLLEALEAGLYEDCGLLNLGVAEIDINLIFVHSCGARLWYRR